MANTARMTIVTLYVLDNRVISTSPNAHQFINSEIGVALQRLGLRGFNIKGQIDNAIFLECTSSKVNLDNIEMFMNINVEDK